MVVELLALVTGDAADAFDVELVKMSLLLNGSRAD